MLITSPGQIKILTTDPLGIRFIIAGVLLQLTGTLIVRKLVNVEY
jgi:Flp pilus assembly protein TadB